MGRFTYFVILADMRTGSNFLEASLNSFPEIDTFGEIFNPHFIGKHNRATLWDIDLAAREKDPIALIDLMIENTDTLPGFRLFSDHDQRVIAHVLNDPNCGKIRLTRDPVESFVSLKIAQTTDQWRLADAKNRRSAKITFDGTAFAHFVSERDKFQRLIAPQLQITGQTAFPIDYADLNDAQVLNGLAKFLGVPSEIKAPAKITKRQNPEPMSEKVTNFAEMQQIIAAQGGSTSPDTDQKRGPNVGSFVVSQSRPLMFIPIAGGPTGQIIDWLGDTQTGLTQKDLRVWQKENRPHRSFSVLAHPVLRAHRAYENLTRNPDFADIAKLAHNRYGVKFMADGDWTPAQYRDGFLSFLGFAKANLAGQTSVRIDPLWATQSSLLRAASDFRPPDILIREPQMVEDLDHVSDAKGLKKPQTPPILVKIYDQTIENRVFSVYRRDYIEFGFTAFSDV